MVICLERSANLHMVQLMPLPLTVSCFSKIQIGFTFLVLVYPGSPGQRAVKLVCVCVCVRVCVCPSVRTCISACIWALPTGLSSTSSCCAALRVSTLLGRSTRLSICLPRTHAHHQDTLCRCSPSYQGTCLGRL